MENLIFDLSYSAEVGEGDYYLFIKDTTKEPFSVVNSFGDLTVLGKNFEIPEHSMKMEKITYINGENSCEVNFRQPNLFRKSTVHIRIPISILLRANPLNKIQLNIAIYTMLNKMLNEKINFYELGYEIYYRFH